MNPLDVLKNDAVLLAHILNALSNAVGGGLGGAWSALQALLSLRDIDLNAFKSSYKDLVNDLDRVQVEEAFKNALQLKNEALQAKLLQSVDVIEEGVSTIEQGLTVYAQAQKVISDAKNIFA